MTRTSKPCFSLQCIKKAVPGISTITVIFIPYALFSPPISSVGARYLDKNDIFHSIRLRCVHPDELFLKPCRPRGEIHGSTESRNATS